MLWKRDRGERMVQPWMHHAPCAYICVTKSWWDQVREIPEILKQETKLASTSGYGVRLARPIGWMGKGASERTLALYQLSFFFLYTFLTIFFFTSFVKCIPTYQQSSSEVQNSFPFSLALFHIWPEYKWIS